MRNVFFYLLIFFGLSNLLPSVLSQNLSAEQQLHTTWNNFRPRDASVYFFRICMPEEYVGYRKKSETVRTKQKINLSDYAKYTCLQILEEELSKKTGKKIIVADPSLAKNNLGVAPVTSCGDGFSSFPGWNKNAFLSYDTDVNYIIKVDVEMISVDRTIYKIDLDYIQPICKITIKVYDRNGKSVGSYKYTLKDYQRMRKNWMKNEAYNELFDTEWRKVYDDGIPVPNIVGYFYQTLHEMMKETDFHL